MRFGVYLMRRGVLTAEQLIEALQEQFDRQPPLGQLAIEEGMLSVREVLEVLRAQSRIAKERFGDAAMELRMLDRSQVAQLLMTQADRIRPLQEVLVELGFASEERLAEELAAFRRDMERTGARQGEPAEASGEQLARQLAFEETPQLAN